jgi:hypothetical protein
MFYCAGIKQDAKAVIFFTLLMFAGLLQAESSDFAATTDSAKKVDAGSAMGDQQQVFRFPDWPERPQSNRQVLPPPPPPPGPYMSSALSDFSVKGPSFGSDSDKFQANKPAAESDPSSIPMETFSPDRPWIDYSHRKHVHNPNCPPACPPQRWMPENGYQYAPLVKKKLYPVVPNRMPGQLKTPDMNWPASRLPSMGGAPVGQYPYAPNYGSRYNTPMN